MSESLVFYRDGGRSKLREEARCRMCLHPRRRRGVRQLTRHHIVPQQWFRTRMQRESGSAWTRLWRLRDAEANIVPLCARCHRDVHADEWARRMLRKVLGANEVAFAIKVFGQASFDAMYPSVSSEVIRKARAA
jgi:hypothetical protein